MSDCVLLVAVVFFGFSLHLGSSIQCWECNSKYDPNCGNPFRNATIALADCGQRFLEHDDTVPATICRKITQTVKDTTIIIRSCGFYKPEEAGTCMLRAGTHRVFMDYCACKGDGCNASTTLQITGWLLATLLIFTLYSSTSHE